MSLEKAFFDPFFFSSFQNLSINLLEALSLAAWSNLSLLFCLSSGWIFLRRLIRVVANRDKGNVSGKNWDLIKNKGEIIFFLPSYLDFCQWFGWIDWWWEGLSIFARELSFVFGERCIWAIWRILSNLSWVWYHLRFWSFLVSFQRGGSSWPWQTCRP